MESYAGFEPASTRMKTLCPKPLDEYDVNVRAMRWRASQVSNLQPPVLETGVLPIELDTQYWLVPQESLELS